MLERLLDCLARGGATLIAFVSGVATLASLGVIRESPFDEILLCGSSKDKFLSAVGTDENTWFKSVFHTNPPLFLRTIIRVVLCIPAPTI